MQIKVKDLKPGDMLPGPDYSEVARIRHNVKDQEVAVTYLDYHTNNEYTSYHHEDTLITIIGDYE